MLTTLPVSGWSLPKVPYFKISEEEEEEEEEEKESLSTIRPNLPAN